MSIKDFTLRGNHAIIKVDGKTGVRPIMIVKCIPYVTKWLNSHYDKDNPEAPMWYYSTDRVTYGNPVNYRGFSEILKKRLAQAGITRRITSHMFRHKEITDLANKLTESEQRMRHGWERTSNMPTLYSHLNQDDLDGKMLEIMGVRKAKPEVEPMKSCAFCNVSYPVEVRFCEVCSRPLDVADAIAMEKESTEKMKAMMSEMMRKEESMKCREKNDESKDNKLSEAQKEIQLLKETIEKLNTAQTE